jgi:hypothetical protein
MLENSGTPYNVICHIMGWRDKSTLGKAVPVERPNFGAGVLAPAPPFY